MDIRQIRYFETIARIGNMSKASKELNVAQPALSKQIQLLEIKVGLKLFERNKKGMVLLEEGKLFLDLVRPLLRQFDEVTEYISGIKSGEVGNVTIGTIPSFTSRLGKILSLVWSENPLVHITIKEGPSRPMVSYVQSDEAHLGITRLPINSPEVNYYILNNDPIRVYVKEDDPLATSKRILPQDLTNRTFYLIRSTLNNSGFDQIIQAFEEAGVQPSVISTIESSPMLFQLIKYGPGIGIAPLSSTETAPKGLRAVPFGVSDLHVPLALIWKKGEINPLAVRIRNMIIEYCQNLSQYEGS